ncbi:MAG TPA: EsaB/YukD family protein, partial [Nocardioides sp.]|nr:EsaB/YukD family protein [Nocardioides sp.]
MHTAYSRITVVTAERSVDLALPSALPVSDVLPQLLRYVAPSGTAENPTTWVLSRLGGTAIPMAQTLAEAAVQDGEVLELGPEGQTVRPIMVDDVRDAVEDSVDSAGGSWTTRTTVSFTVLTGSITLLLLALVSLVGAVATRAAWPADLASTQTSAVLALLLVGATWWASVRARPVDTAIAAAAAMTWGAALGLAVCRHAGVPAPATL